MLWLLEAGAQALLDRGFDIRSGLPLATIESIAFDTRGFAWIATRQGLYRLDHHKSRRIDADSVGGRPPSRDFHLVQPLSDRWMLVGTDRDAYLFDIPGNRFHDLAGFDPAGSSGPLIIADTASRNSEQWLLTTDGRLFHLGLQGTQPRLSLRYRSGPDSDLEWHALAPTTSGLLLAQRHRLLHVNERGDLIAEAPWPVSQGIRYLFRSRAGDMWMSAGHGLYRLDIATLEATRMPGIEERLHSITEDAEGNLWIAKTILGLIKVPREGPVQDFGSALAKDGINQVTALTTDPHGSIWLGGTGRLRMGIIAANHPAVVKEFTRNPEASLIYPVVSQLHLEGDRLWLGAFGGLNVLPLAGGAATTVPVPGLQEGMMITDIRELDPDTMLLASMVGLHAVNKTSLVATPLREWRPLPETFEALEQVMVYQAYTPPDAAGANRVIWLPTQKGLYRWRLAPNQLERVPLVDSAGNESHRNIPDVSSVLQDHHGRLWLAGWDKFGFFDSDGNYHSRLEELGTRRFRPSAIPMVLVGDKQLWLGTLSGLYVVDTDSGETRRPLRESGLKCGRVHTLERIDRRMIVGCNEYLVIIDLENLSTVTYPKRPLLMPKGFVPGASLHDPDSSLVYFGTPTGVRALQPDLLIPGRGSHPGHVQVEALTLHAAGETRVVLQPASTITVPPGVHTAALSFANLNYLDQEPLSLDYQLQPEWGEAPEDFIHLEGQSSLNFTGLAPGSYQLRVRAGEPKQIMDFTVHAQVHWWASSWFRTLLLLAALALPLLILLRRQRHIAHIRHINSQLAQLANYDALTGLPNRHLFAGNLATVIADARARDGKLALLFLDLDRFKGVNDSYGHSLGDELLRDASARLLDVVGDRDRLCRFGGDEFLVILPEPNDAGDLDDLCRSLLDTLSRPYRLQGRELYLSVSIGVSVWPDNGRTPETLTKNADHAMYLAKAAGRNNYRVYTSDMDQAALHALELETALHQALQADELALHYQPQYTASLPTVAVGVEALLRWQRPGEGFVNPEAVVRAARSSGLARALDEWVLRRACRDLAPRLARAPGDFKVSANVTTETFCDPGFIDLVKSVLADHAIAPRRLCLEITEGSLMEDLATAGTHTRQLRKMGVQVAIDDFGTGYSSLAYLRNLRVHVIKVDRAFVFNIDGSAYNRAIVQSVIDIARNLDLEVTAEGVETQQQLQMLRVMGCTFIQGYLFARPMPLEKLHECLEQPPEARPEGV